MTPTSMGDADEVDEGAVPFEDAVVARDDAGRDRPSPFVGCVGLVALAGVVLLSLAAAAGLTYLLVQLARSAF